VNLGGEDNGGGGAILLILAPHTPQNLPFSATGEPQDAQILTAAGAEIPEAGGAGSGCSPAGDPQIPQYFSSGLRGLPQSRQSARTTGSACTSGSTGITGDAVGACRDCGG
jgi:hypothetical protein